MDDYEFDATTLVGDVRDAMLAELKVAHDKPWNLRPEAEQRAVAERVHDVARGMVRTAVTIISASGFPFLQGTLEAVAVKSGFKAVVKIPKGADHWEDLIRSEGRDVVLVIADPSEFFMTRGAVTITPDQAPLPYATEAARVADAAETPPEGWDGEDESAAAEEAAPPVDYDEGVVMDDPIFREAIADYTAFAVSHVTDGTAIWHCWRDSNGLVRCHEHHDEAVKIAARQKAEWEESAWDTAEDRAKPKKGKKVITEEGAV